jgi:hypothetical protein
VSFIRHAKIYRYDRQGEAEQKANLPSDHRFDESSAGYSFVGCSPAAPTSASPAANSFSLYPAAVQFSAANRNCHSIRLSQPRGVSWTGRCEEIGKCTHTAIVTYAVDLYSGIVSTLPDPPLPRLASTEEGQTERYLCLNDHVNLVNGPSIPPTPSYRDSLSSSLAAHRY